MTDKSFGFLVQKNGFKTFNYRSNYKDRKSLALLRGKRSSEKSNNLDSDKMNLKFGDYKINTIMSNLVDQHNNLTLYVIGNHAVAHENYLNGRIHSDYRYNDALVGENKQYERLYTYGDHVYAEYIDRTFDVDSKWCKMRVQYIVEEYFDNSSNVQALSRRDVNNGIINGVKLNKFGFDNIGITIGIGIHRKNKKKPSGHGTVRFL